MICLKFNAQNRPTDWQDRQTTSTTSSCNNQWTKKNYKILLTNRSPSIMIWIKVEETSNLEVGLTKKIRKCEETKKYKNKMKIVEK